MPSAKAMALPGQCNSLEDKAAPGDVLPHTQPNGESSYLHPGTSCHTALGGGGGVVAQTTSGQYGEQVPEPQSKLRAEERSLGFVCQLMLRCGVSQRPSGVGGTTWDTPPMSPTASLVLLS